MVRVEPVISHRRELVSAPIETAALLQAAEPPASEAVALQAVADDVPAPNSMAEYGSCQLEAKGEDTLSVCKVDGAAAFGVFDGHGGRQSSRFCAEQLLQDLLASGFPTREALVDAFWRADESLGRCGVTDGTTATVLVVQRPTGSDEGCECILGWVGDSRALCVDISAGRLALATRNHSPKMAEEVASLQRMAAVRTLVESGVELRRALLSEAIMPADMPADQLS